MGDSEKLTPSGPDRYTFVEHRDYLHGALDALDVKQDVIWVIHDWGSALGFDHIAQYPGRVSGVCYMEAIVCPLTWDVWPDSARDIFQTFRSSAGEEVVLEKNVFVKKVFVVTILKNVIKRGIMGGSKRGVLDRGKATNIIEPCHEKVTVSNSVTGHWRGFITSARCWQPAFRRDKPTTCSWNEEW